MLSIIIPSYNEEGNVARCASVVSKLLSENGIDYELVFVNDGSKDKTWDIISNLARNDEHIVGVNFSRNFGKESAIFAGLETAKGDACVLLDCDLQFPHEVIMLTLLRAEKTPVEKKTLYTNSSPCGFTR